MATDDRGVGGGPLQPLHQLNEELVRGYTFGASWDWAICFNPSH